METLSTLFLAISEPLDFVLVIGLPIVALILGGIIGFLYFNSVYRKNTEKKIGDANKRAEEILANAESEGKRLKKEAILEAKEQDLKLRKEFEHESKEKKAELQRLESRLNQREDVLDKKESALDKKNEALDRQKNALTAKEAEVAAVQEKLDHQHELMVQELEKVAQLTKDEATNLLREEILQETRESVAVQVRNMEQAAKDEADLNAKNIIALAIQRCAADQASEKTVSTVPLPNDDMKARIIGREGRNIRALENATGIELIIDDTPEVVILSGFDPVRREIARVALERLISDGRIHPARIEETVEKVRKELDQQIKEAGENAMFEVGIFGLHPELIKLIGKLKYRTSYGQNVYKHSIEVAQLAGLMAQELGLDVNFAKRAGLLHDIGKALNHEIEGSHVEIGVDVCRKFKESPAVIHAVEAHHNDVEPKTLEAIVVQAADAISGARPGARRESIENYVKRLEKLESLANSFAGVEQSYAIQAGREIRVIVKPEEVNDSQTTFMAKEIAKKLEAELDYPGQIKVNVIRELRRVEYAK